LSRIVAALVRRRQKHTRQFKPLPHIVVERGVKRLGEEVPNGVRLDTKQGFSVQT
jgi:hypothetical protein